MLKLMKKLFSKQTLDVNHIPKPNGRFTLNAKHGDRDVHFISHHPIFSEIHLPNDGLLGLHKEDVVHSHHLRIQRTNGDILKIFQCPKNSFTLVELIKNNHFNMILAKTKEGVFVDGVDYNADTSAYLIKKYISLFKKYKRIMNADSYF